MGFALRSNAFCRQGAPIKPSCDFFWASRMLCTSSSSFHLRLHGLTAQTLSFLTTGNKICSNHDVPLVSLGLGLASHLDHQSPTRLFICLPVLSPRFWLAERVPPTSAFLRRAVTARRAVGFLRLSALVGTSSECSHPSAELFGKTQSSQTMSEYKSICGELARSVPDSQRPCFCMSAACTAPCPSSPSL